MEYTAREIVEATGVPLRTIRLWVSRGLVPKPQGRGAGTRYLEEHRLKIRAVVAFREQGNFFLIGIRKALRKMSLDDMRALIGEAEAGDDAGDDAEASDSGASAALPPPAATGALPSADGAAALAFPTEAAHLVVIPLLPHLALMVGEAASPIVRRIAQEIVSKYGQT
jgi:DNA-binding transcriptional MerR regulator